MGKQRIMVITPGGMKGKTSGDIIEEPTPAELELARANPRGARILEDTPPDSHKARGKGKTSPDKEVTD